MSEKVLILGKGASGEAAAALLRARGRDIGFADGVSLVVASPGVKVRSELHVGCEDLARRGVKLLAVTGSKGKSSVVKVVADTLTLAGHRAIACGNYGIPVSEVGECEWAVVEVSSFQLETTHLPPGAFEAAAVLNLQEDHLDRHESVEVYHALKLRLLDMAKVRIGPDVEPTEAERALFRGSYFDNDVLASNGAAAVRLLCAAGLEDARIARGFAAFEPLPHRMNLVCTVDGVRYVDDSKATSIAALAAGVRMAGSGIRLIAGGLEKGDDPKDAIFSLTNRVKKVYLMGHSAEKFLSAWRSAVDCEVCGTIDAAVEAAKREAVEGETVLLSPGAASFDQFHSFEERGEAFARLVKKG